MDQKSLLLHLEQIKLLAEKLKEQDFGNEAIGPKSVELMLKRIVSSAETVSYWLTETED